VSGTRTPPGTIRWHTFDTPLGRMYAAASERGLCRLSWHVRSPQAFEQELRTRFPGRRLRRDPHGLARVEREVRSFLEGHRHAFSVDLDLSALSDFQRRVLEATRRVPFGETSSYSELARRLRRPRAARAVGNALRANPVPLVIPCHRIVRADGSLGGYSGIAAVNEKRRLLQHEAQASRPRSRTRKLDEHSCR
jgi:O-6-methylguanine DNA methyltransferase